MAQTAAHLVDQPLADEAFKRLFATVSPREEGEFSALAQTRVGLGRHQGDCMKEPSLNVV